jgi:hypothetical protein
LTVFSAPTCDYGFRYRYKHFNANGTYRQPPSHSVGYLRESSFNNDGSLNVPVRYPYTSSFTAGYIRLTQPTNAYINVINGITTGDLFGVETRLFDNANPVTTLTVGVAKQRQIFNTPTSPYAFSVNHYINISTSGAIQGNSFKLDLRGNITIGGNSLIITQNYINSGSPGTTILNISSAFYISQILANNLTVELYFDGSNWRFFDYISKDDVIANATNTTAGIAKLYTDLSASNVDGSVTQAAVVNALGGLITKVINIGDWNMDANSSTNVAHGLSDFLKIRTVSVMIRRDDDSFFYDLQVVNFLNGLTSGSVLSIGPTNIILQRTDTGAFDSIDFNATSFNRGWVTIQYLP